MKKIFYIVLFIFILPGCTKQLLIKNYPYGLTSYPMFGQIPERSFYYPIDFPDSLELLWNKSTTGSFSNNSVVIEGNYVFTSDLAGNIFCFDNDEGKVIGADKGKGEIAISPILNYGIMFYIITVPNKHHSLLVSYDIRKGERIKEIEIAGRVSNEMIKLQDSFVFVSDNGVVYKYSYLMQMIWKLDIKSKVASSPAALGDRLYLVTYEGDFVCINLEKGSVYYKESLNSNFESALVVTDKYGIIGDENGTLFAVNLKDGSIKWTAETNTKIKSPSVHNNKLIYTADLGGSVYAFEIETGEKKWSYNSDGLFNAPAALFNNILIQPDVNRKLIFLNPFTGELIKTMEFDSRVKMHPTYFNDILYVGIDRGELLAYKLIFE